MQQFEFKCASCGEVHVGLPSLHTPAPLAVRDVPHDQRSDRVVLDSVACVCAIDDKRFFMQAQMRFPVHGVEERLEYSVWAELSPDDFHRQTELWQDLARVDGGPLKVRLEAFLPSWPEVDTVGELDIQPPGTKPNLRLVGDDPLSIAQASGVTRARAAEIVSVSLHGAPATRRTIDELLDVPSPAWAELQSWLAKGDNNVEVLPIEPSIGRSSLEALQVTAASGLGALGLETGGLRVGDGWLWILGGGEGGDGLSNLIDANGLDRGPSEMAARGFLIVAYDALGGLFAVNDVGLLGRAGEVHYRAPDTLEWEALDMGHTAFVRWACTGDLSSFFQHLLTPGLLDAASRLDSGQALSIYPFPFAKGEPLDQRSRRAVPMRELFELYRR